MRFNGLWWFVPMEALPLILVGGALLVILRIIRPERLLLLAVGLALLPILPPLIEAVFDVLPWWMVLGIVAAVALSFVRSVTALFIGTRAADHMMGSLAASAVIGTLRLAFALPVTFVRLLARRH